METYLSFKDVFLVLKVIRTVIYVEYPPISVDPLLPTGLGRKKTLHSFINLLQTIKPRVDKCLFIDLLQIFL